MRSEDEDTRWLVLTLFFGAVAGSIAAVVGLAAGHDTAPWSLSAGNFEAGVLGGGVLSGGLTFLLAMAACALRRDRPYPIGYILLIPLVGSAAIGLLVFVCTSANVWA